MTIIAPRFLHYLLIVDIESGKTLHAIPTLDCYNSKAATWAFESKERNVTPRWPHEDLALFMPNDSGILVRQSAFQIDIYDFESERTIQSFNVLKTHGVKNMISTFAFTDDGYLRTFLWPSSPLLSAHSDLRLFEDITDIPEYIDWDIRTGKIVREGPLTKGSDGSWGMDNVSAKLLETFEEILGKSALYNPNLQLMWSFYVGGDTKHRNAGISHSCLYVTYDDPAATLYHTVVHTGCVAANGVTPATSGNVDQPIFDAIWNKIKGLENYSVTIANGAVVNNELLYYYGRGVNDASTLKKLPVECVVSGNQAPYTITQATGISAPTIARQKEIIATKELLQYFDGKCEAWAVFLIDVLAVQGISSTKKEIYLPNNSQNDPNAFKVNTTTLGQGKANPRPGEVVWGNHYVVEYVGKIYDPSYGEEYGNSNVALANFAQKCVSMGDSYPNISQIFLPHPPMCYR